MMQTPAFRRFFQCAAIAATIAVADAATPRLAIAQATAMDSSATATSRTTDRDDDGFDMGWLGLLGLAGLLGLRRRDNVVHHTDTTTRRP
jgi:MYXO-CTERM domain-containing protein